MGNLDTDAGADVDYVNLAQQLWAAYTNSKSEKPVIYLESKTLLVDLARLKEQMLLLPDEQAGKLELECGLPADPLTPKGRSKLESCFCIDIGSFLASLEAS